MPRLAKIALAAVLSVIPAIGSAEPLKFWEGGGWTVTVEIKDDGTIGRCNAELGGLQNRMLNVGGYAFGAAGLFFGDPQWQFRDQFASLGVEIDGRVFQLEGEKVETVVAFFLSKEDGNLEVLDALGAAKRISLIGRRGERMASFDLGEEASAAIAELRRCQKLISF